MSKDMLGPITRALVGIPDSRLGVVADIANRLNGEQGDAWHTRFKALLREGLPQAAPAEQPKRLSVVATTNLGAVGEKKTEQCFTGSRWYYRDGDFDKWLTVNQPKADVCTVTTLTTSKDGTFIEWVKLILGNLSDKSSIALGNELIKRGYTMTLAQAEEMVEVTERGEKTGIRTDGWGNFFFVKTGDAKNPVSVGYVYRGGRAWYADVRRLYSDNVWSAGSCLLFRNLDASKL